MIVIGIARGHWGR